MAKEGQRFHYTQAKRPYWAFINHALASQVVPRRPRGGKGRSRAGAREYSTRHHLQAHASIRHVITEVTHIELLSHCDVAVGGPKSVQVEHIFLHPWSKKKASK
jgi:hypothetical protein